MGVDVAAAGQGLPDEGVCFAVGAGVPGVDSDGPGEGGGGVERGDPDGVGDDLMVWMSRSCWPGLTWPSGSLAGMARWVAWAVSRSASAVRRAAVSWSWSVLVISTDIPGSQGS